MRLDMKWTVSHHYSGRTIADTKALQRHYSFCIFKFTAIFKELPHRWTIFFRPFIYSSDVVSSCRLITRRRAKYKPDCSDSSHTVRSLPSPKKRKKKVFAEQTLLILFLYILRNRQSLSCLPVRWADACNSSAAKVVQQAHVKSLHLRLGEIEHVIAHCLSQKLIGKALRACVCVRVSMQNEHINWFCVFVLLSTKETFFRGACFGPECYSVEALLSLDLCA